MSIETHCTENGRVPRTPWGVVLLAHGSQRGNDTYEGLQEMVRNAAASASALCFGRRPPGALAFPTHQKRATDKSDALP